MIAASDASVPTSAGCGMRGQSNHANGSCSPAGSVSERAAAVVCPTYCRSRPTTTSAFGRFTFKQRIDLSIISSRPDVKYTCGRPLGPRCMRVST